MLFGAKDSISGQPLFKVIEDLSVGIFPEPGVVLNPLVVNIVPESIGVNCAGKLNDRGIQKYQNRGEHESKCRAFVETLCEQKKSEGKPVEHETRAVAVASVPTAINRNDCNISKE